jgi:hypothetical protein
VLLLFRSEPDFAAASARGGQNEAVVRGCSARTLSRTSSISSRGREISVQVSPSNNGNIGADDEGEDAGMLIVGADTNVEEDKE